MLQYRKGLSSDVALLARMNHALIADEGHRNTMSLAELEARMRAWLEHEYEAVVFERSGTPLAYALYRQDGDDTYLRQFFVEPAHRRRGVGRDAMGIFLDKVISPGQRVVLDVLIHNGAGRAFWTSVGFQDYAVTMEAWSP